MPISGLSYVHRSVDLTTRGDLLTRNASDVVRLALGTSGQVLTSNGTDVIWSSTPSVDHGSLTGLGDDDHTQYALLAGRAGGQILYGGNASGNNLTLNSTSHSTKGLVVFDTSTYVDQANTQCIFQKTKTPTAENQTYFFVAPYWNGAYGGMQGARFAPNFGPTSNVSSGFGFIGVGYASPGSGVTIVALYGGYSSVGYTDVAGAVTSAYSHFIGAPEIYGALKPTTQYGLFIDNQGASGITSAVGLHIAAMSGASNNWDMSFGRVDTTAAGAYYGRIPVYYNGLTKYIHVFSA